MIVAQVMGNKNKSNHMNKTQEVSELLKPRVRCKGNGKFHFPGSGFVAGEILDVAQDGARLVSIKTGTSVDWLKYKNYPHLFEEIPWWQDREVSEMPEYVKFVGDGSIRKVERWDMETSSPWFMYLEGDARPYSPGGSALVNTNWLPATKSDYDQYIKSLTKVK